MPKKPHGKLTEEDLNKITTLGARDITADADIALMLGWSEQHFHRIKKKSASALRDKKRLGELKIKLEDEERLEQRCKNGDWDAIKFRIERREKREAAKLKRELAKNNMVIYHKDGTITAPAEKAVFVLPPNGREVKEVK